MPVTTVDGNHILDSGALLVRGLDPEIEISFGYSMRQHQVALKFRQEEDADPGVRYGSPRSDRTVVHLVNFFAKYGGPVAAMRVGIGKIDNDDLFLAISIDTSAPLHSPDFRRITYMLYTPGRDVS